MERSKRLWIVTFANVAVAFLLLLVLYAISLALAALAPEISGSPLCILLPLGLALSVVGLMLTKSVASRWSRSIVYVVNGGPTILENGALVNKSCHPRSQRDVAAFEKHWKAK